MRLTRKKNWNQQSKVFKSFFQINVSKKFALFRTSDELLQELFGVIGYSGVSIPELFNDSDKKKKKKKKRKHENSDNDDEDKSDKSSKKAKKSKKEKKIKKEKEDREIKDEFRKIKQEKPDKEQVTERRELSIVIKDLKYKSSDIKKPSSSHSKHSEKDDKKRRRSKERSKEKEKRRSKDKEKERSKDKKRTIDNSSDISLSDEETYRKHYEYHMSSRWDKHSREKIGRDWDRDKRRTDRGRDDRQ